MYTGKGKSHPTLDEVQSIVFKVTLSLKDPLALNSSLQHAYHYLQIVEQNEALNQNVAPETRIF